MQEISWFIALGAGLLSFISPCILPLLPAYLSFITGVATDKIMEGRSRPRSVLPPVFLFCLGFSAVFILMGATASTLGQVMFQYQRIIQWAGGIIVILFGLHLLGLFKLKFLQIEKKIHLQNRPTHALGAFIIGVAFAAGWTPCIGPILGSILAYAATEETIVQGIILLGFYSLGLAIPFCIIGFTIGSFVSWFSRLKRLMRWVSLMSGALLIFMGVLLITNNLRLF